MHILARSSRRKWTSLSAFYTRITFQEEDTATVVATVVVEVVVGTVVVTEEGTVAEEVEATAAEGGGQEVRETDIATELRRCLFACMSFALCFLWLVAPPMFCKKGQ